ncbi:MAG: formamidopyrimidine-DNA glycosylase [Myxococcales bacterium]|nr:formamidopyrimidine-DNA glycosylase [Myxococcales bacterium]MCB9521112.1 formamidopyrimidine-DNA glycosylase [Myxococcales bacterium]MCB9531860.1 formamidopyrimidine-DNA glycosylase [Myxococcales bacterium]
MPEIPDLYAYRRAIEQRALGAVVGAVRIGSPFVLRSVVPPLDEAVGQRLAAVSLVGKRVVLSLSDADAPASRALVIHLMIAGRFQWRPFGAPLPKGLGLVAVDFVDAGTLLLTEVSKKKRASLHYVEVGELDEFDRGGVDPMTASQAALAAALQRENRTLKRALTDPTIVAGVGNAYSDEILHAARLSPMQRTQSLNPEELERLCATTRATLELWVERLAHEFGGEFPAKVTAFRPDMAVHGRYRQPCPTCGAAVQRIRYAENEANYCAVCQTGGRLLADRGLSRLMHSDWPRTLDELEARKGRG